MKYNIEKVPTTTTPTSMLSTIETEESSKSPVEEIGDEETNGVDAGFELEVELGIGVDEGDGFGFMFGLGFGVDNDVVFGVAV